MSNNVEEGKYRWDENKYSDIQENKGGINGNKERESKKGQRVGKREGGMDGGKTEIGQTLHHSKPSRHLARPRE
jgi:hypothetical protein